MEQTATPARSGLWNLIKTFFVVEYFTLNILIPKGLYESTRHTPALHSYEQYVRQDMESFKKEPFLSSKLGDVIFATTYVGRNVVYGIEWCFNKEQ